MPLCNCGNVYVGNAGACQACIVASIEDGGVAREEYQCDGCGCTDDDACPGGCSWIAPNVCSNCAHLLVEA